ncbi:CGNR zinc finger domain-containing protein [Streptomyces sp. NPDC051018]|uniref:CGNR zinc finger domain-containing protein n=1 Tax=Streptomyces sp. NPDC051018 TaxID=3365639 RepID=UPI0037B2C777
MSDNTPLTGEHLALDLVNTHPYATDLLTTPAGLARWLALESGRIPGESARPTRADLELVREVRAATAAALGAVRRGERPPTDALEVLNRAQLDAPAVRRLGWDGTAVTAVSHRVGATAGRRVAGWLAEAAAELLSGPDAGRVRECEAPDCVMLFLPANPRRRWCSASRCGNRTRVARHYARQKGAGREAEGAHGEAEGA